MDHHVPDPGSLMARINAQWAGDKLQNDFRREVADLLQRHSLSFPGAQPVSFSRQHIQELKHQDYYVCEKTDGLRFLFYLTQDVNEHGIPTGIHYLIDRRNDYYYVPHLHFPHHEDKSFKRFHTETILDGELVEDKYPDGRPSVIKFLVFDCLILDGTLLMQRPLDKRLAYFKSHVMQPYKEFFKQNPEHERPFVLEDKATEFSYALEKMFKEIIPKVKQLHGNDGLIFTCKNTPYKTGTDPHILKWKPPSENTVDFLLHIEWAKTEADPADPDQSLQDDYHAFPDRFGLCIHNGSNEYALIGDLFVEPAEWEHLKSLNRPLQNCIVECFQDDSHRWRFHRFRDDKDDANHSSVYKSVLESIESRVTEEDLLAHADEIRTAWKLRDVEAQKKLAAKRKA